MKRLLPLCILLLLLPLPGNAQFFYFGRNKISYTDFDWMVLKTEHFDIYYDAEMKDLAERGAHVAEEAYREFQVKFQHSLGTRVPLVFYSSHLNFQQTNVIGGFIPEGVGGFFEFMKGRVVIPSDGSFAQFRHVVRHELVHVFMHAKVTRIMQDHRKSLDRYPPLWFTEGLAEYWSTQWDAQAEMVMRDGVLNSLVVGLDDMNLIYGTFLMYKEGQNALRFLGRKYGEEKILLLLENLWKEASFSTVMKLTIGKDYKEFDTEWLYALRKEYFPLMAAHDAPSRAARLVTTEGFNAKPVMDDRDTVRHLYVVSNRTGYTGIYRKDLKDPDPRAPLEEIVGGERSDEFEAFHFFRSRIDLSTGRVLAFVTKSGAHDALHLYDVREESVTETFRFASIVSISSPSWDPSGRRIVFSGLDRKGNTDLYILDTETRELTRLTNDLFDDRDPAWSPSGDRIVFSSDRGADGRSGFYNLFSCTPDGRSIAYLTCGPHNDTSPSWSRDGGHIAFTSDLDGVQNIWLMDLRRSDSTGFRSMVKLTHFVTSAFDPSWTGDGGLVFSTFEHFGFQVQSLPRVTAIAETSHTVVPMDLLARDAVWAPPALAGANTMERFRYRGDYSLDIAQSAVSTSPVFGTAAGAFVALSDILGNDQYYFTVYNNAQTQDEILSSFNVAISRLSLSNRTAYAYGIYRFAGRVYDLTAEDQYYYEKVFGGYLSLSYPLSKFQRLETSVSLSNSMRDNFTFNERRALLLSNSVEFVHDNSLWGPTGPLDGRRFSLMLAYTSDIQYSNVNYFSIIADYRQYFRLDLRSAFATRWWLFYNDGKESRRFVMGGSWDLRGWPRWSIRGEKLWLVSNELRFPLLDELGLRFPFGGISFGAFRGALFADVGGAWDDFHRGTYGSVGGGLRLNLFGAIVLRYDIGKTIIQNLTRFQPGLFYQFFFGWDF